MRRVAIGAMVLGGLTVLGIAAQSQTTTVIRLTSLDWPPYSGAALVGGGASVAVSRAALKAAGLQLEVAFFPWQRAMAYGLGRPEYAGYFPEYWAPERACAWSDSLGTSPLGFVQHRDAPIRWQRLEDLAGTPIGTVSGYVNTTRFDALAASGRLQVDPVPNDLINLRKVAARRIPMAVIDPHVLAYLIRAENIIGEELLEMNPRLLEIKQLYICFRDTVRGRELRDRFNDGLQRIDATAIRARHMPR